MRYKHVACTKKYYKRMIWQSNLLPNAHQAPALERAKVINLTIETNAA